MNLGHGESAKERALSPRLFDPPIPHFICREGGKANGEEGVRVEKSPLPLWPFPLPYKTLSTSVEVVAEGVGEACCREIGQVFERYDHLIHREF